MVKGRTWLIHCLHLNFSDTFLLIFLKNLECLDNGKSWKECNAVDIELTLKCYRYFAGWADKIQGKTIPCGKKHDGSIALFSGV